MPYARDIESLAGESGEQPQDESMSLGSDHRLQDPSCRSESTLSPHKATPFHEEKTSSLPSTSQSSSLPPESRTFGSALSHIVLNLAPSFWSLTMGTGIASVLLHEYPYPARWLRILGEIVFVLNIVLFALLFIGNLARYITYKSLLSCVNCHLASGLFWGCLPMGFATIVNMVAYVCAPWSHQWARLALALWWIDVVSSVFINLAMVFLIFARHVHTSASMSAVWLLPIVSSVVAAASGGVVSQALLPYDPILSHSVILVSYIVWGTGVPLALMVITLWIYRTATEGIPAPAALPSLFLPLGPCGQGAFGIILLGRVSRDLAYDHGISFTKSSISSPDGILRIGDAVYVTGLTMGMILWGLGFCWYILGMAITIDHALKHRVYLSPTSFTIAWTAYTFPLGVWATATTLLATEFDSPAFRVVGAVISAQVILNWVYVFVLTCWRGWTGALWAAPEIAGYQVRKRFG